jgi:hypothetical protein
MSWRDKPTEDCEMRQVLSATTARRSAACCASYGGSSTYAYTTTGALRRLARARPTTRRGARSAPRRARCGEGD